MLCQLLISTSAQCSRTLVRCYLILPKVIDKPKMKVFIFLTCLVALTLADNGYKYNPKRLTLCGRRLAAAMTVVCKEDQYLMRLSEAFRSNEKNTRNRILVNWFNILKTWLPTNINSGRGVTENCCARVKGCTINELRAYCYYEKYVG